MQRWFDISKLDKETPLNRNNGIFFFKTLFSQEPLEEWENYFQRHWFSGKKILCLCWMWTNILIEFTNDWYLEKFFMQPTPVWREKHQNVLNVKLIWKHYRIVWRVPGQEFIVRIIQNWNFQWNWGDNLRRYWVLLKVPSHMIYDMICWTHY